MPPSSAIQARIKALEAATTEKHAPGYPPIDLSSYDHESLDVISLGSPNSESFASLPSATLNDIPSRPSRSPSPAILGRQSSLVDLSDSVAAQVPQAPSLPVRPPHIVAKPAIGMGYPGGGKPPSFRHVSDSSLILVNPGDSARNSLIAFDTIPLPSPPALPPRKKSSIPSLSRQASSSSSSQPPPPLPKRNTSSPVTIPKPDSTKLAPGHTYPPLNPKGKKHAHANSSSSFHSVSLSDGGDPPSYQPDGVFLHPHGTKPDSLAPHPHPQTRRAPPNPPTKPSAKPPPTTAPPTRRKPPIPPTARKRYDALFSENLSTSSRTPKSSLSLTPRRTKNGWRGLSVDESDGSSAFAAVQAQGQGQVDGGDEGRLNGQIVKMIWACSKLERDILRIIWGDCDTDKKGSLDREAFASGMWRIDEELKKSMIKKPGGANRRSLH